MDSPTLRQLRTFIAAVETGSITEAARLLNLTQPAASQQLRELERILSGRLLDRADGRVIPTAVGQAILDTARRAQLAAADMVAIAAAHTSGDVGRVRFGTGATACIYLLPGVLAGAKRRMPGLEITVATGNTSDIVRRVQDGSLDAGLVTQSRALSRALTRISLRRDPLMALVPDRTPGNGPLTPAHAATLPLILYEAGGDTRGIVDAWFAKAGVTPKPQMALGSVEAIKVLVGSGLGASILPQLALMGGVAGAQIRPLRPALARDLIIVLRQEKVLDRGLRLFIELLQRAA